VAEANVTGRIVPFDLDAWIAKQARRVPGFRRRVAEALAAIRREQTSSRPARRNPAARTKSRGA
jgi:hypothetical protein